MAMPEHMQKLLMAIAVHMIRNDHDGRYTAVWSQISDIAQNEVDNLSITIDHDNTLVHFKVERYQEEKPTLYLELRKFYSRQKKEKLPLNQEDIDVLRSMGISHD